MAPAGVERFHLADAHAHRLEELRSLFKQVGLIDEIAPTKKHYHYVLVHGGNVLTTRARLLYLVKLWQHGIRFDQIVFLTGQRMLDPEKESVETLCDRNQKILPIRADWQYDAAKLPTTEADMMAFIYHQAELPQDLRAVPLVVIDAPQITMPDGTKRRPNTESTIHTWLQTKPMPGSCLAVSNQPFIGYQDSIMHSFLPAAFTFETVGLGIPPVYQSVTLVLDSLARWLYQENVRRK